MNKWVGQVKSETTALLSKPILFLLPLLYGFWFAFELSHIAPPASENLYAYAYQFHKVKHVLTLGVAFMLGIWSIRSDFHRPGYSWMGSLPVSIWTRITAKYTVYLIYLSLFTAAMAIVFIYYGWIRQLSVSAVIDYTLLFALQYEVSYAVTLALAMLLSAWIPGRITYLIGFCAWMFGTFFLDVFIINRYELYPLATFHLSQFLVDSLLESELWGHSIIADELWYARGFTLSVTLLLLVAAAAYLTLHRPSRLRRWWLGLCAGAAALAILCFIPYGKLWIDRYKEYEAAREEAASYEQLVSKNKPDEFRIGEYQLSVSRISNHRIQVDAVLTIPNYDQEKTASLPFVLNRNLEVTRVQWNHQSVAWVRDGDRFILESVRPDPDLEFQTLGLSYNGPLYEWMVLSERPAIPIFLSGKNAFLPESAAWYPLPGEQFRYFKGRMDTDKLYLNTEAGLEYKARFKVQFQGFDHRLYGTIPETESSKPGNQQFESAEADGLTALSGSFIEVTVPEEPVRIITTPSNKLEAERFLRDLSKHLNYYRSWLNEPPNGIDQIFYLSLANQGYVGGMAKVTGHSLILSETTSHNLDKYQLGKTVNAYLFGDLHMNYYSEPEEEQPHSIVGLIRNAFYYLYLREEMHFTHEQIVKGSLAGVYPLLSLNQGTDLYAMIDRAIAEGKTAQVKSLLNTFYQRGLSIQSHSSEADISVITEQEWLEEWNRVMQPYSGEER